jgi:23S rRNA U2552 (ribose-2'-O)-methylase RlmE/FtsJ
MDLYVGLGDQRHAVRLLQLFYLQHSRAGVTFPVYEDDGGAACCPPRNGSRRGGGGRRRRRRGGGGGDEAAAAAERGDTAAPAPAPAFAKALGALEDPREASDPFYRMVGDTSALDGCVRIFPGVEREEDEAAEDGGGAAPLVAARAARPEQQRRRWRLVFARAAVEMGPCTNRHGPAGVYFSGLTVPPQLVIAWLKRSFVGRHVQRAFFVPRQPQPRASGAAAAAAEAAAAKDAAASPNQKTGGKDALNPLGTSHWGGMARTPEQAAAEGWALAAQVPGLDGVRVACSNRRLQQEVVAALDARLGARGAASAAGDSSGGHGAADGPGAATAQPRALRLEPTAAATHAFCVARVSVADLRAAGACLPPGDDGGADPALAARAAERTLELEAQRGSVGAREAAEAAALAAPHRYVWSLTPVAWLHRLAWDEPATHGGIGGGGDGSGRKQEDGGGGAGAAAVGCAHAVHKLDEALRVLGLAGDGTDELDGRAARADVTPEERAAWQAYVDRWAEAEAAAAGAGEGNDGGGGTSANAAPARLRLRRVLDVGAAPGSWTALMARRIMQTEQQQQQQQVAAKEKGATAAAAAAAPVVVAVDPADLDPACLALPLVRHLRVAAGTDEAAREIREALAAGATPPSSSAAAAANGADGAPPAPPPPACSSSPSSSPALLQVDLLTCDANTHPKYTLSKMVLPLLPHLRPGGLLVVTLKLHGTGRLRGRVSADCARQLEGSGVLPGAALWLMANTNNERTYVARKREDWVD